MSTTYRACYYTNPRTGQQTVLTRPEDAGMSSFALRAMAIREARRAGIVYTGERASPEDGEPRVHMDDLRAGLSIGDWHDR